MRIHTGCFREHGGWVVALLLAALAALLISVCDSGGHHRLLDSRPDRSAVSVSELSSGYADPDPSCAPGVEHHLAAQVDQRQPLQGPPAAVGDRPGVTGSSPHIGTPRRGPPAAGGREVLGRGCVSRT
ncbi:hypothetical protein ACFRR7_19005 [Streptomyces sp. NPDC056909]|uniref:hypothetical protein n=1 Tax=Streptomyces sp. NPDC056909 TaxID=3345963 RepID=UPI0036B5CAB8